MVREQPIKIEAYPSDLEEMLCGIEILCNGLSGSAFQFRLQGVLEANKELSEYQNAHDYLCEHYDELQGAIRTIGAAVSLINSAIANEYVQIVAKE